MLSHNGERGRAGSRGDCGRHFFSQSGGAGTWDAARLHGASEQGGCAYWRDGVRFADGEERTFWRRERPHLVIGPDGFTLEALTTGGVDCWGQPGFAGCTDASYTVLQGISH
jgi:hypothetical protein